MKVVLVKGLSYGLKGRLFVGGEPVDVSDEDGQYLLNNTEGKFRKVVRGVEVMNEVDLTEQAAEREGAREFKLSDLVANAPAPVPDEVPVLSTATEKKGGVKIVKTGKKTAVVTGDDSGDVLFDTAVGNPAAEDAEDTSEEGETGEDTEEKVDL